MQMKTGEMIMNNAKAPDLQHACIFLQKPFADCYCMNISSSNISKMLAFCTGDFRSCPIYCQFAEENEKPIACGIATCSAGLK
jgi:hypothetical protein